MAKYGFKMMMTKVSRASELATLHEYGYIYGVETDIRVTSDGVYVMRHETYVEDSESTQYTIASTDYATLKNADDTLLTLAEHIALTDAYSFKVVYDMKISDATHATNLWTIFQNSNANLENVYIEPYAGGYEQYWISKDLRINYCREASDIDSYSQYATGLNHIIIMRSVSWSTTENWTDSFKEKLRKYNMEVACHNVLNLNTNIDATKAYPFDIYWTPYIHFFPTMKTILEEYEDEKGALDLETYLTDLADAVRTGYDVGDDIKALEVKNAIRYIASQMS